MDVSIEERVLFRHDTVGYNALTTAERNYWLIWTLEAVVNNGGLTSFFADHEDLVGSTATALTQIGAIKMATFVTDGFKAHSSKNEVLVEKLDRSFTDYPEDIGTLIDIYVQKHADQFLGPITSQEMWHAKKTLGIDPSPKFVTREIDFDKEAISDAAYSNRNCPSCTQPVPDYRRTCKKCGYPIGKHLSEKL